MGKQLVRATQRLNLVRKQDKNLNFILKLNSRIS